jgi:hypothetical protein
MPHIEDVLLYSLTQSGDKYVFGAEVPLKADDSDRWDCSELVEWSCGKAGVKPTMPDGAFYQWKHCKDRGMTIPVSRGLAIRGALLFVGDGTGIGRDAVTHVAWSLGDGTTIEARGKRWGVGSWPSASRFDFAGLVPGADYSPRQPLPPEDDMPLTSDQEAALALIPATHMLAKATADRVAALADDVPDNLTDQLAELRRNIRTIAKTVGVPAADIET